MRKEEDYFDMKLRLEEECKVFKTLYIKNRLQSIRPYWHLSWKSIEDDKKINETLEKPNPEEYKIYTTVPLKELMLSIEPHLNVIISEETLFHSQNRYPIAKLIFSDRKTCKILKRWEEEKPLLPPQIDFIGTSMTLVNGTHRLNAAFCLGAERIPVMIYNRHREHKLIPTKYLALFGKLLPEA